MIIQHAALDWSLWAREGHRVVEIQVRTGFDLREIHATCWWIWGDLFDLDDRE